MAAAFGVFLSWVWLELAICGDMSDCEGKTAGQWALAVAILGLLAAGAAVWQLHGRHRRNGIVLLALGFLAYAAWAVLLDAAVHGWDDLRLLP